MIIRGKEIKPETITMWLNIISFFVGVIFYADVIFKFSHPQAQIAPDNKAAAQLVIIDAKLHDEIRDLKIQQDSLVHVLQNSQVKQDKGLVQEAGERKQIYTTIHSGWDKLPPQVQENYVSQLLIKLKKHQL